MVYSHEKTPNHDPIAMVANIAGIASFILAVAGNNLEKLSHLQKLGLSVASTVMIFVFTGGLLVRYVTQQVEARQPGAAVAALLFGGWIGAGLLLAAIPLFGFGLATPQIDLISMIAAGVFATIFTVLAVTTAYSNSRS